MQALITGSNGLIGQELIASHPKYFHWLGLSKGPNESSMLPEHMYISYDLTIKGTLYYLLSKYSKLKFIVHTAAFTNVDTAETMSTKELHGINVDVTKELCDVAKQMGVKFIFLSTDYVFDGTLSSYKETDKLNPINAYAKSKALAEEYILKTNPNSLVIRTSTPFTDKTHKKLDFARWVYSSLKANKEIKVATDQISNPTYIPQLAGAIGTVMDSGTLGIIHIAGDLAISRYDFAMGIAKDLKLDTNLIKPVTTAELNQIAKRPLNTSLDTSQFQKIVHDKHHIPLHEGFSSFVKGIKAENRKLKTMPFRPVPNPSNGKDILK